MTDFLNALNAGITAVSDFVCGYPLFILLIGGGLFLFFYSGAVSLRHIGDSMKALRYKSEISGEGQITSFQALMSAIASTVGMGNIAGVAIAITVGGPGAIFWMWVSAIVGMSTKFFEGTLAIMYKGHDSAGQPQGGTMYILQHGLGKRWKPLALFFAVVGLVGTLCVMQANQLVESVTTVFTTPMGIENTLMLRFIMGVVISLIVGIVILGGIQRISIISEKIVPVMVACYMILVFVIIILNFDKLPGVFYSIFHSAFNWEAGIGGILGTALIGARRAAYVNEAGVGTASMMHGASRNDNPIREGLVAMIGPAIDSGLVCTLTALPILIAGEYASSDGIKGLYIALNSFEKLLPGYGHYLLMVIVFFFAFSTMFSYSYYGLKCTNYLFGAHNAKYYNYFYLVMIVVAAMIPLGVVVAVMDLAFALMAVPTMTSLLLLAPRVKQKMKEYFSK
ncbi:MAG: alanine:cation symporter family protein [Mediterranea massiliensis]|nr:alanine:cation symporter family protein [Mediterranea massiliensis]